MIQTILIILALLMGYRLTLGVTSCINPNCQKIFDASLPKCPYCGDSQIYP